MRTLSTRRQLLAAGAAGAASWALPLRAGAARRVRRPLAGSAAFPAGVAAGQPNLRGITLWTWLDGLEETSRAVVEIARDADFRHVVHRQGVLATEAHAFTAKTRVLTRNLAPGEEYHYRFATRTTSSPVGRFRTARPADSREPLRVGFFSCQQWQAGYYVAHRALAREDCDLIVCLGDYIYETNGDKGLPGRADSTGGPNGQNETLDEYRAKYRLYRSDPDLQAMHASAAFIATWDDHEVENNHADGTPGTTRARRIPYAERRKNAYAAFFEQMPQKRIGSEADRVYRKLRLGGLVDLFMLDLRAYRDDQACGDRPGVPCGEHDDPDRTLLGARQKQWLKAGLERSRATWKVLGSSVEMMGWDGVPFQPLNPDAWDGYAAERREVLEHALAKDVKDIAVVTGDIHVYKAGDVTTTGRVDGRPAAVEFIGSSITSDGLRELEDYAMPAEAEQRAANPHWSFVDFKRRGYGVLEARPDELRVVFRSPTTVKRPDAPVEDLARFVVRRGTPHVERVG